MYADEGLLVTDQYTKPNCLFMSKYTCLYMHIMYCVAGPPPRDHT